MSTLSERAIEAHACKFAKARGVLPMKLAGPNQRGQPDRMFLRDGVTLFIEFKRLGKQPTPLQWKWIKLLRSHGFAADWAATKEWAEELIIKTFP